MALYGCTVRYGGSLEPRPGVQQGAKVERWLADIPAAPVLVDEPFLFQCSCDVMERVVAVARGMVRRGPREHTM